VTFGHPYLLLTLLALPLALATHWLVQRRRRMRYTIRFTNVEVLATVVGGRSWRRAVPAGVFVLALATLCAALARPHVHTGVPLDNATVILVLDVSGSMQAQDVKPTRLAAAQKAIHSFLDKVPSRLKVGLVLFAAEAQVATPPTTDHGLVGQAVDDATFFEGYGGTAIGDALATAVRLGQEVTGVGGQQAAPAERTLAALRTAAAAAGNAGKTLVSILFLSDGHQTRGTLQPLDGAALAKQAGFPVYTVSLGTTGNTTLRGGFQGGFFGGGGGVFGGAGLGNALAPDPATLRAIATETGGQFFRARSAGAVEAAYSKLGSSIGRAPGKTEVTGDFLAGGAALLVLAGLLGALWAPRLP
jgi:Ca-activated chloride channel family protein